MQGGAISWQNVQFVKKHNHLETKFQSLVHTLVEELEELLNQILEQ